MIDRDLFAHFYEDAAYDKMDLIPFEKQLVNHYNEYKLPMLLPDLYGKTVRVSPFQFKGLHEAAERLADLLDMPVPDIYVYENFYYTVESKGLERNWIEMSAKTLIELGDKEVTFLLAKEMCAIKLKHTYYYTLIEEAVNASGIAGAVPIFGDAARQAQKVQLYQWVRVSHYTTDNFAYLACADLTPCVSGIIKTVLNNTFIARHVNVTEFIKQAEQINALAGKAQALSKADEQVPYAPNRIKNLMWYASTARGLKALRELNRIRDGG